MAEIKSKLFSKITTVPAALQSNYYPALDGLRGIAILMVVFTHFGINIILPRGLRVDSLIGVDIFFVLSGFLITTLLIKEKLKNGQISLMNFYIRRILRIVPLVYLYLIVLVFIGVFYKPMSSASDFVLSFLFLKNLPIPNQRFTANLWTLSVEEQFYIFLPVLIYLNINRYFVFAISVAILIPLISIAAYYHIGGYYYLSKIGMYFFWKGPTIILIGSVMAILTFKGIINVGWGSKYYWLSFILLVIAIAINTQTFILYSKYISEYLSAVIMTYVVLLSLNSGNFLSRILSSRLLVKIGVLSYSLYIWQQLFIGSGVWIPGLKFLNSYPILVIMAVKLAILFPVAYISYHYFESRFLKLKERYKQTCVNSHLFNP